MALLTIEPQTEQQLRKAHYGTFEHGAVEICHWTKSSLNSGGDCYKKKFYNIDTHRCMEFTPVGIWCQHNCVFCWRPMELFRMRQIDESIVMEPAELVAGLMRERERLLSGFWGSAKVDLNKLREAYTPTHYAISLSGEPTMYPKLPGLIKHLHSLLPTKSVFLVTNGQEPQMLERLESTDSLPSQLYLSTNAPNKQLFLKINLPEYRDCWERYLQSLDFLRKTRIRTVMRLTMINGVNMDQGLLPQYAEIVSRGNPHFVEIKSYMNVGRSTERLSRENMATHDEIHDYAKRLIERLPNFEIIDSSEPSRVFLLQNRERMVARFIV